METHFSFFDLVMLRSSKSIVLRTDFIEPESISARTRTWSTNQSINGWIMVELSIVLTTGWARCPPTFRPFFRSLKNALIYTLSRSGRVFRRCNKSRSAVQQSFAVACIVEQNDPVDHMYSRNQTSLTVEMETVQNYPHVSNGPLELVVSPRYQQPYKKALLVGGLPMSGKQHQRVQKVARPRLNNQAHGIVG